MNRKLALRISAAALALTALSGCIATTGGHPSVSSTAQPGTEAAAWEAWDRIHGETLLRMDPSRPFKVTFVGAADIYPSPVTEYDAVLPSVDGKWYIFRAEYTG